MAKTACYSESEDRGHTHRKVSGGTPNGETDSKLPIRGDLILEIGDEKDQDQERRKRPATLGDWEDASVGEVFVVPSWDFHLILRNHLKAYLGLHACNPSTTLGKQEDVWACLPANTAQVVSPGSQRKSLPPSTRWTVPEELTPRDDLCPPCAHMHTRSPQRHVCTYNEARVVPKCWDRETNRGTGDKGKARAGKRRHQPRKVGGERGRNA